jgi:DNA replication protein DnaC
MALELKKNESLDLKTPKFLCDGILNPMMCNYEMLNHLNGFRFTTICGLPGSGKTSLIVSFITNKAVFKKVFNHIEVVMPSTSIQSMAKNPFKKHPPDKLHEELDYETTEAIYNKLEERSEEKESTLLILDDVAASLKTKTIQKLLRKIIYNRRHLKCHIVMMVQSYIAIPKEIRKLNDNVIMFKPSKVEFENLFVELFQTKKDLAIDIMNMAYQEKHDYLFLNVPTQKIYRMFDEIIIHDENEK